MHLWILRVENSCSLAQGDKVLPKILAIMCANDGLESDDVAGERPRFITLALDPMSCDSHKRGLGLIH